VSAVETRTVDRDEAGMRLDRWFKLHFPGVGFGHLQKLLRSGQIRVNGGRVETSTRLAAGQQVRVPPLQIRRPGQRAGPCPEERRPRSAGSGAPA
jgi:23S rRNA pseudouridine955/2504/2580 synthase